MMAKRKTKTSTAQQPKTQVDIGSWGPAGSTIEIPPLLDLPMGFLPSVIKCDFNRPQRETLKRLTETLQSEAVQLADGKYVSRPVDSIRWLLEQIAASE